MIFQLLLIVLSHIVSLESRLEFRVFRLQVTSDDKRHCFGLCEFADNSTFQPVLTKWDCYNFQRLWIKVQIPFFAPDRQLFIIKQTEMNL